MKLSLRNRRQRVHLLLAVCTLSIYAWLDPKLDLLFLNFVHNHSSSVRSHASKSNPTSNQLLHVTPIPSLILRTFKTKDKHQIIEAAKNGSDDAKLRWSWYETWDNIIFDDEDSDRFVRGSFSNAVQKAYFRLPRIVQRSDFVRYLMLYEFGGVYTDMDTVCFTAIDQWTRRYANVSAILGIEVFGAIHGKDQIAQWTMALSPKHEFLEMMIRRLTERILSSSMDVLTNVDAIVGLTGPAFWSESFWLYMDQKGIDSSRFQTLDRGYRKIDGVLLLGRVYFRHPGIFSKHRGTGELKSGWKNEKNIPKLSSGPPGLAVDDGVSAVKKKLVSDGQIPKRIFLRGDTGTSKCAAANPDHLFLQFDHWDMKRFVRGSFGGHVWRAFSKLDGYPLQQRYGQLLLLYYFGGFWLSNSHCESSVESFFSADQNASCLLGIQDSSEIIISATPKHAFTEKLVTDLTNSILNFQIAADATTHRSLLETGLIADLVRGHIGDLQAIMNCLRIVRKLVSSRRAPYIFLVTLACVLIGLVHSVYLDLLLLNFVHNHFGATRHSDSVSHIGIGSDGGTLAHAIPSLILRTFKTSERTTIIEAARNGSDDATMRWKWFKTWDNLNPNHVQIIFDDNDSDRFVRGAFSESVAAAYFKLPRVVQRSDFARYLMLYEFGGVYTDMDTECWVPIDKWTYGHPSVSAILGIEVFGQIDGLDQAAQWTMAVAPKHPFLERLIRNLSKRILSSSDEMLISVDEVVEVTGPVFWSKTLWDHLSGMEFDIKSLQGIDRSYKILGDFMLLGRIHFYRPGIFSRHRGTGEMKNGWKNQKKPELLNTTLDVPIPNNVNPASIMAEHSIPFRIMRPVRTNSRKEVRHLLLERYPSQNGYTWFESWETINRDHLQMLFSDDDLDRFVKGFFSKRISAAYFKLPLAVRFEFGKYLMLYIFGGLYVGTGVECLQPIDGFVADVDLILALHGEGGSFTDGFFAASRKNPFVLHLINDITKKIEASDKSSDGHFSTLAGADAIQKAVSDYFKVSADTLKMAHTDGNVTLGRTMFFDLAGSKLFAVHDKKL
ncbi:membrane-bound alpha-1,6- mannosyltransferase Initiation-specific [Chytriomyces hyalinus]|nr:membrane-bound alpha-1,6- mannosyltransferase Initiation-specific [Chytriomyces hyalinus]